MLCVQKPPGEDEDDAAEDPPAEEAGHRLRVFRPFVPELRRSVKESYRVYNGVYRITLSEPEMYVEQ